MFLHQTGSNNPIGVNSNLDKINFHPFFSFKDTLGFILVLWGLCIIRTVAPFILGDTENFIPANPLVTPVHIQPEWYFLFAYAILRSIPNKLGGVVALVMSIAILYLIPFTVKFKIQGNQFFPLTQVAFWSLLVVVIILTWIGARPVEDPYIIVGQLITLVYFINYIVISLSKEIWEKALTI